MTTSPADELVCIAVDEPSLRRLVAERLGTRF